MLCDLIPKSPQSGWDMVGLIQEVWEGKKVESQLSAQKSILKATRSSGFFRSWNYIEYLREEIQCVWCWWKFYWLGCKMQPQIRNWNPGDCPHNLQLAWVLTACAVSSISMPQIRAPPKIIHNKETSFFLLSKGVRACFHGFSGFFVKTMVELTGYQAISDKLCTLFKFVSLLHALHMQTASENNVLAAIWRNCWLTGNPRPLAASSALAAWPKVFKQRQHDIQVCRFRHFMVERLWRAANGIDIFWWWCFDPPMQPWTSWKIELPHRIESIPGPQRDNILKN